MSKPKPKHKSNLWTSCLNDVGSYISPQHFATWFKPIKLVQGDAESEALSGAAHDNNEINLEVPNKFFLEWIKEHYLVLIEDVLRKEAQGEVHINWRLRDVETYEQRTLPGIQPSEKEKAKLKKKESVNAPSGEPRKRIALPKTKLNEKYTMDNFVVGKANEFAFAASSAVTKGLAKKYNPLFIYGDVGLGKTHLLQAIGNEAIRLNPGINVCYYTSEKFMNEFIRYVSRHKMNDFRNKFRKVDLLLIDDIQFWSGKERTQEEFFHTFNALYEDQKQIVVTSDKYPKDIEGIEERLRSRFEWGLVADIQPPDQETKIAILNRNAEKENITLSPEVSHWIASVSSSNVRELEGFLNRVIAVSSLTGKDITLNLAQDALENVIKATKDNIVTISKIQQVVAKYYDIKISELISKKRNKQIALPRQIAMFFAREYGDFSFPEIGSAFGGKDHSTVIHACKKITKMVEEDKNFRKNLMGIKGLLGL